MSLRALVALLVSVASMDCVWAYHCPNGYDRITLQLTWIVQPQFAGYVVADRMGFYSEECLEIHLEPGGVTVNVFDEVIANRSQLGIAWLDETIVARETQKGGQDLVLLSQIFQRAGHCMVQWKDSGLRTVLDLKDKTVCVWPHKETSLRQLCTKYNLTWDEASSRQGRSPPSAYFDVVPKTISMSAFLRHECDSAAAMSYSEVASIYEVPDPATGRLYTKDDLYFIDFNADGVATMEDGIIASSTWLDQEGNADIAVRFLRASFKGWMYARDFPNEALNFFSISSPLTTFQMHEINKLIWPTSISIGLTSDALIQRTADSIYRFGVISRPVDLSSFYRKDLAAAAHQGLGTTGFIWGPTAFGPGSADTAGKNWKGIEVSFCQIGDSMLVCEFLKKVTCLGPWLNFSDPILITILVLLILLIALTLALIGVLVHYKLHRTIPRPESVELIEERIP